MDYAMYLFLERVPHMLGYPPYDSLAYTVEPPYLKTVYIEQQAVLTTAAEYQFFYN